MGERVVTTEEVRGLGLTSTESACTLQHPHSSSEDITHNAVVESAWFWGVTVLSLCAIALFSSPRPPWHRDPPPPPSFSSYWGKTQSVAGLKLGPVKRLLKKSHADEKENINNSHKCYCSPGVWDISFSPPTTSGQNTMTVSSAGRSFTCRRTLHTKSRFLLVSACDNSDLYFYLIPFRFLLCTALRCLQDHWTWLQFLTWT